MNTMNTKYLTRNTTTTTFRTIISIFLKIVVVVCIASPLNVTGVSDHQYAGALITAPVVLPSKALSLPVVPALPRYPAGQDRPFVLLELDPFIGFDAAQNVNVTPVVTRAFFPNIHHSIAEIESDDAIGVFRTAVASIVTNTEAFLTSAFHFRDLLSIDASRAFKARAASYLAKAKYVMNRVVKRENDIDTPEPIVSYQRMRQYLHNISLLMCNFTDNNAFSFASSFLQAWRVASYTIVKMNRESFIRMEAEIDTSNVLNTTQFELASVQETHVQGILLELLRAKHPEFEVRNTTLSEKRRLLLMLILLLFCWMHHSKFGYTIPCRVKYRKVEASVETLPFWRLTTHDLRTLRPRVALASGNDEGFEILLLRQGCDSSDRYAIDSSIKDQALRRSFVRRKRILRIEIIQNMHRHGQRHVHQRDAVTFKTALSPVQEVGDEILRCGRPDDIGVVFCSGVTTKASITEYLVKVASVVQQLSLEKKRCLDTQYVEAAALLKFESNSTAAEDSASLTSIEEEKEEEHIEDIADELELGVTVEASVETLPFWRLTTHDLRTLRPRVALASGNDEGFEILLLRQGCDSSDRYAIDSSIKDQALRRSFVRRKRILRIEIIQNMHRHGQRHVHQRDAVTFKTALSPVQEVGDEILRCGRPDDIGVVFCSGVTTKASITEYLVKVASVVQQLSLEKKRCLDTQYVEAAALLKFESNSTAAEDSASLTSIEEEKEEEHIEDIADELELGSGYKFDRKARRVRFSHRVTG